MFDLTPYQKRMKTALEHLEEELKKVRTGRAHPDMLSGVLVEVYGTFVPLNQVASISSPEPQQLLVTPFDVANVQPVVVAIRKNEALGLNPADDGRNVRVVIPPLTEERRREIVKSLGSMIEEARVALRNIREDARKAAKVKKEAKEFGEDELKRIDKAIDDEVAKNNAEIDKIFAAKQSEIMTI